VIDPAVTEFKKAYAKVRAAGVATATRPISRRSRPPSRAGAAQAIREPAPGAQPTLGAIQASFPKVSGGKLKLWKVDRDELAAFGGELDLAVQMPADQCLDDADPKPRRHAGDGRQHADRVRVLGR